MKIDPQDIKNKQLQALLATQRTMSDSEKQKAYRKVEKGLGLKRNSSSRIGFSVAKYAAAVVVTFLLTHSVNRYLSVSDSKEIPTTYSEIIVPNGQSAKVVLPDSSKVFLNSGSQLRYPSVFNREKRAIELSGEAYFEVATDKEHPFVVNTNAFNVVVTGTQFNLSAYAGEPTTAVLVEGEIIIQKEGFKEMMRLVPGQAMEWSPEKKKFSLSQVDSEMYTQWQEGIVVFRDKPFTEVANQLSRWYNVKVQIESPEAAQLLINGAIIKNKPLDQVLEILRITHGIRYSIDYMKHETLVVIN
jgi:ferric-dicitrate binding protein FerR (iron transport regulator)